MSKQISILYWLPCFSILMSLLHVAHAEETPCPESGCPAEIQSTPTLRESIDQARNKMTEKLFGIELTGFGDALSFYDDNSDKKFDWGSFELGATGDFAENLQAAFAIVRSQEGWEQTAGVIDFHTDGIGRIAPRGRITAEKGVHIQLGRFDIPFGNDWQFFPSKDSISMSRPITTDQIMDGGYSDEGVRILGNNGFVNFSGYIVHGFNYGRLLGTRIGLTPFNDPFALSGTKDPKSVELGWSYFYDTTDSGWVKNESAWAIDAEILHGDWHAMFEYMVRKKEPITGLSDILSGWHVTQEYGLGETIAWPTTVFLRYEQSTVQPAEIESLGAGSGDERDERIVSGFNVKVGGSDVLLWKFELQHQLSSTPSTRATPGFGPSNVWFTQLVLIL